MPRRPRRRSSPSARASASTTSARPPVLAHGSHSAARNATRIGMRRHRSRARRGAGSRRAGPPRVGALNRFTAGSDRVSCPLMDPVRVPPSRLPASRCHPGSRACGVSPTTSTGRGTRGRAACSTSIDRTAWTRYRNPIPVISGPTDWARLLDDAKFLAEYHDVLAEFDALHGQRLGPLVPAPLRRPADGPIAYFCAEYGFHESLGIYSGGLGVLAGDHMKTASDMALPSIGVGLLYRKGYFRQTIDADGHQEHDYPDYDLTRLPLGRVQDRRAAAQRDRRAARARPVDRGLDRPGRPRPGPAARHGPARERRVRPADHQHPVRPRPRDAAPPGARPRHRRRPRDPCARARPVGLAPQRGPLGVPARGARPRARGGREDARATPGRRSSATASSRSTRRSRPATSASTPTSSGASPGRSSTAGERPRRARPRARARRRTATRASST